MKKFLIAILLLINIASFAQIKTTSPSKRKTLSSVKVGTRLLADIDMRTKYNEMWDRVDTMYVLNLVNDKYSHIYDFGYIYLPHGLKDAKDIKQVLLESLGQGNGYNVTFEMNGESYYVNVIKSTVGLHYEGGYTYFTKAQIEKLFK